MERAIKAASDPTQTSPPAGNGLGDFPITNRPSCRADDLKLQWPMNGTNGNKWVINNYVDLNTNNTLLLDFVGNMNALARTYDNHRGVDIDISSFREMDDNSAVVRAAANGEVIFVREDQPDRNMISLNSCTATWNVVTLRHTNGFETIYGHLKRNSVSVEVGDKVKAGDKLGVAGSSGCSTHPHLHFQAKNCSGDAFETFAASMWENPPLYNAESWVMDIMLRGGSLPTVNQIKDPAPNENVVVSPGGTLGIGLSLSAHGGDVVLIKILDPGLNEFASWTWTVPSGIYRHRFPSWTRTLDTQKGTWRVFAGVNGWIHQTTEFKVQ